MTVFGTVDGTDVPLMTIRSSGGLMAQLVPYGARLVRLVVPDGDGRPVDVILGHDSLQGYLDHPTYFGATCGRYANRIAGGRFVLDGAVVQLDRNEGENHLHGGRGGLHGKIWRIEEVGPDLVRFSVVSPAGEMGYPGRLEVETLYRFTQEALRIEMTARTDAPTVVNLVNHAYFNLDGQGDILDHRMRLPAQFYTPVTGDLLTTGEVRHVAGSGFDFLDMRPLREAMAGDPALVDGWDHNWCLTGPSGDDGLHAAAWLSGPSRGVTMEVRTDQPGVQVYACGQMRKPVPGKGGQSYGRFAGLTFETQRFPCSPNHMHFPSSRLDPGQVYRHVMELRFGTAGASG